MPDAYILPVLLAAIGLALIILDSWQRRSAKRDWDRAGREAHRRVYGKEPPEDLK